MKVAGFDSAPAIKKFHLVVVEANFILCALLIVSITNNFDLDVKL